MEKERAGHPEETWPGLLLKAAVILLIGSGAGLAYNGLSSRGISLQTPTQTPVSEAIHWQLHVLDLRVDLANAKRAFDSRSALFVDARSTRSYDAGHIPGAFHLPVSEWERIEDLLGDRPRETPIITYCGGGSCQISIKLADRLIESHRFARVRAFYDGWAAWISAGYPVATGDAP